MMEAPITKLVYASRHAESNPPARISNDITVVEMDRKQSAPTCKSAVNMFKARELPVFLWLL